MQTGATPDKFAFPQFALLEQNLRISRGAHTSALRRPFARRALPADSVVKELGRGLYLLTLSYERQPA